MNDGPTPDLALHLGWVRLIMNAIRDSAEFRARWPN